MSIIHGTTTIDSVNHENTTIRIVKHGSTTVFQGYAVTLTKNGNGISTYGWSTSTTGSPAYNTGALAPNGATVYMFVKLSQCITAGGSGWTYVSGTPFCADSVYRVASGTVNGADITLSNTSATIINNSIRLIVKDSTSNTRVFFGGHGSSGDMLWVGRPDSPALMNMADTSHAFARCPNGSSSITNLGGDFTEGNPNYFEWYWGMVFRNINSLDNPSSQTPTYAYSQYANASVACNDGDPRDTNTVISLYGGISSLSNLYSYTNEPTNIVAVFEDLLDETTT